MSGDLNAYKQLLVNTREHLMKNCEQIKMSDSPQYNIISKLFSTLVRGDNSIRLQKYNLLYWDDANELVNGLRVLYASFATGNTGVCM